MNLSAPLLQCGLPVGLSFGLSGLAGIMAVLNNLGLIEPPVRQK